jgi:hypothetical protein
MPVRPLDNHLAEIDANADIDTLILGEAGVPLRHAALDLDGAFDRVDYAPNSARRPSPISLKIEPRCAVIAGSTSSVRRVQSRSKVPASSNSIRRL